MFTDIKKRESEELRRESGVQKEERVRDQNALLRRDLEETKQRLNYMEIKLEYSEKEQEEYYGSEGCGGELGKSRGD